MAYYVMKIEAISWCRRSGMILPGFQVSVLDFGLLIRVWILEFGFHVSGFGTLI